MRGQELRVEKRDTLFPYTTLFRSNAFAHLDIADRRSGKTEFSGWMVAASPALSALDDPRYDVWLLRCKTS